MLCDRRRAVFLVWGRSTGTIIKIRRQSSGQRRLFERWRRSRPSCGLTKAIRSYRSDFQGCAPVHRFTAHKLSSSLVRPDGRWSVVIRGGESRDVNKLSLLLKSSVFPLYWDRKKCEKKKPPGSGGIWSQCGIQREGSQTTTAFLSTVNKLFFTCTFSSSSLVPAQDRRWAAWRQTWLDLTYRRVRVLCSKAL